MDECIIKSLDNTYNQAMLDILSKAPINANGLHLQFDKSPDIFTIPRLKYSSNDHLGFFIKDELKGFGSLGYFDAIVQGQVEKVFTFYNFYLLPAARGKQIPALAMKEFFKRVKGRSNFGISITMKGNKAAESYMGYAHDEWMPKRRIIDQLVVKSILFARPKKNDTAYVVRNAGIEDVGDIIRLLKEEHEPRDFGMIFNEDIFFQNLTSRALTIDKYYVATDKSGRIKGVCLAWDCSSFRRTKVHRFSPGFYPILTGYKLLQGLFPIAPFPKRGESFLELTITDHAVSDRDPEIMHALLSEVYRRHHSRKYHFMTWGSCGSDPILTAAKGFWHTDIVSNIMFTSMDPMRYNYSPKLSYIDIAFL